MPVLIRRVARLTPMALVFWLFICPPISSNAREPAFDPILRIETGMHTSQIRSIGIDRAETVLATAADDTTIRIWNLQTGRLQRVLRVPVDQQQLDDLRAIAVSPDGGTVAVGGRTGSLRDGGYTVYLFDIRTGGIKRRLAGLPGIIEKLSFSPDGLFLAANLRSGWGLVVFETTSWQIHAKDGDYREAVYSAAFDQSGRLVTASYDGLIRLYDPSFNRIAAIDTPGGNLPIAVAFSRDGAQIAVSYHDSSRVDVLSGRDLAYQFSPNTEGIKGNLLAVAWSADGSFLYAGGNVASKNYRGHQNKCIIHRWDDGGKGTIRDIPGAEGTIVEIQPLAEGGIVYAAGTPAWGQIAESGTPIRFIPAPVLSFDKAIDDFMRSADARMIRFACGAESDQYAVFDAENLTLTIGGDDSKLGPPLHRVFQGNLSVTDWHRRHTPKLNGRPLDLKNHERSHSLSIAKDGNSFVLGTDWYIRRYRADGHLMWKKTVPYAWAVNIDWNLNTVVAALGDGTIRWYRLRDGEELLALFPHKDGKRWVLWTPSGYYAASVGGDGLVGWQVGRGWDQAPDFFPAARFRETYYRPDVIKLLFDTLNEKEAVRRADAEAGRKQKAAALSNQLPPVIILLAPADGAAFTGTAVTVRYAIRSPSGQPVTAVRVLIDGRPLSSHRGIRVKAAATNTGSFKIQLPRKDCEIGVIAENRHAASEPARARLKWQGKVLQENSRSVQPDLYVLSVGVGDYALEALDLTYPAKDARDLAAVLARQRGRFYGDVMIKVLTDQAATAGDVLDGLDWIERVITSNDVAVIFLAGHGVNNRYGDYYFLPQNGDPDRLRRTGVPYTVLKDVVTSLPGKVLFFIDTCYSGNVMGSSGRPADVIAVANDLSADENGVVVFAAATGRQFSLENEVWENGAFTKALVEALSGKADYTADGQISINEMDLYLSERVKNLTNGQQTPTTSKPKMVPDFPVAGQ